MKKKHCRESSHKHVYFQMIKNVHLNSLWGILSDHTDHQQDWQPPKLMSVHSMLPKGDITRSNRMIKLTLCGKMTNFVVQNQLKSAKHQTVKHRTIFPTIRRIRGWTVHFATDKGWAEKMKCRADLDTGLGDWNGLLFHGFVNSHLVSQVHLVKLIDAAYTLKYRNHTKRAKREQQKKLETKS